MFQTIKGYHINKKFPNGFSSVIESWFNVILQYEEQTGGDAIYWYNERPNVSAFAAALALNNIAAIQEYSCLKGKGADKGRGRADLWFCRHDKGYLVEAKLKWRRPTSGGLDLKDINADACEDAKRSWQQVRNYIPIGLTFVVPYIPQQDKGRITEYVTAISRQLENENLYDLWAYCAPGRLRKLQAKNTNYYPMVLLLAENLECQ